jgi:hypothetical protein
VLRRHDSDGELIIWRVGIILQQRFDPLRFPFDNRAVEVWLQPAELERNVVLTPDCLPAARSGHAGADLRLLDE